ncbi:MAG: hypothetical protein PHE79_08575 [Eubacteriales bacterium]|nr:hypothetical protein [Eubacteriales bacterium]
MAEMCKKIAKLIDVKSIISLIAAVIFAVLAIRGELGTDNVMILLTLVFQSFFSYQTHKKDGEQK